MTYEEKQIKGLLEVFYPHKEHYPTRLEAALIQMFNQAMQAQREATLNRMNQYAIDSTGEPLPPEMQFIILHTEVQP